MYQKLWKLIGKLESYSDYGSRKWEETTSPNAFQLSLPEYVLRIAESGNDYVISIFNNNGRLVEAASDSDFTDNGVLGAYQALRRLYEKARRSAVGAEKAVDDILKSLDDLPL